MSAVNVTIDPARPLEVASSEPLTAAVFEIAQAGRRIVVEANPDGTAELREGQGVDLGRPVDVFVSAGAYRVAALDVTGESLTLPVRVETRDPRPVSNDWRRIELQLGGWTPSAVGQRSEAVVVLRERDAVRVPDQINHIFDHYATASFFSGSGTVECVCVGGSGDECQGGKVECTDPGGFADRASGVTLFAATDQVELGFVERVTRTSDGAFIETGRLYYEPVFPMPGTGAVQRHIMPDRDPDFDACGRDGRATLTLLKLPRSFVRAERTGGGVQIWLWLVSPGGLRMPLLTGGVVPAEQLEPEGDTQVLRWRYPFVTGLPDDDFSYEISAQATLSRATGGVEQIRIATTRIGLADICSVQLSMNADGPLEFVSPDTAGTFNLADQDIEWLSAGQPVKRLRWTSSGVTSTVWLLDPLRGRLSASDLTVWNFADPVTSGFELTVWDSPSVDGDLVRFVVPEGPVAARSLVR